MYLCTFADHYQLGIILLASCARACSCSYNLFLIGWIGDNPDYPIGPFLHPPPYQMSKALNILSATTLIYVELVVPLAPPDFRFRYFD